DLISCRNLLIYLERDVQRDVVEVFHYALNPDGVLLLGTAETPDSADLFRIVDKRMCIYRRRNIPAKEPRLPVFPLVRTRLDPAKSRGEDGGESIGYGALHQQMAEKYAPPSILVSPDNNVVHLSQNAGRYLMHSGGEPTTSVIKLLREELRIEAQAA